MLLVLLLLTTEQGNAFECSKARTVIFPCWSFFNRIEDKPSRNCCNGVEYIKSLTPTLNERRTACECIKGLAINFPVFSEELAASLSKRCGINMGFTISKYIDCNK